MALLPFMEILLVGDKELIRALKRRIWGLPLNSFRFWTFSKYGMPFRGVLEVPNIDVIFRS